MGNKAFSINLNVQNVNGMTPMYGYQLLTLVTTPVPDEVTRLEVITAPGALAPSLVKVVKMAGGEKGPLSSICCPETGGIRTPQTRMVYSVLGSSPPARNWMSEPE